MFLLTLPFDGLTLLAYWLGFALLAGGLVGTRVVLHWLWHQLNHRATGQALGLLPLLSQFSRLMQAGIVILMLSGGFEYPKIDWAVFDSIEEAGKLGLYMGMFLIQLLLVKPSIRELTKYLLQLPAPFPDRCDFTPLPIVLIRLYHRLKLAILIQLMLVAPLLLITFK